MSDKLNSSLTFTEVALYFYMFFVHYLRSFEVWLSRQTAFSMMWCQSNVTSTNQLIHLPMTSLMPRLIWFCWAHMNRFKRNLVLIAYASSECSGEPVHPRSLARTSAARSYKQWVKRNLKTESQILGPSEWLGMRSYNLSWWNAWRHKFAWRGSYIIILILSCPNSFVIKQSLDTGRCNTMINNYYLFTI